MGTLSLTALPLVDVLAWISTHAILWLMVAGLGLAAFLLLYSVYRAMFLLMRYMAGEWW